MEKINEHNYELKIIHVIRKHINDPNLPELISGYHENDVAGALEQLTIDERKIIYPILGAEKVAEIFSYIEDAHEYLKEIDIKKAAKVIEFMDSDDAVDVLEDMDDSTQERIIGLMDTETSHDIQLILSYDENEIGSIMTTNFIEIASTLNIRQAMRELVRQAGENDNISTIYVRDEQGKFYGAIDLKDLIIARDFVELDSLISTSYPYLTAHEKISDCIEKIKEYAEDSLPVLNENKEILGIITAQDIVEVVDDEMGDDYAKLAGLTAEEDLHEKTFDSMKKRLPWLIVLLFLGLGVSSVVGIFEGVVAKISIVICFQSLILGMAGNVGTQSLAVTVRVLIDENLKTKQKVQLVFKEMKIGLCNGLFLGLITLVLIGGYIFIFKHTTVTYAFLVSACVGFSLLFSMIISSLVGTVVPLFFHKIKVDPAVASGPLITTVNDLVAVVTYYGLAWILLINVMHIA